MFGGNMDKLDRELERMARRNFNFVMSMQRFSKFDKEEHENAGSLWRAYPDLQIAYLEEEAPHKQGGEFIHRCAHNLSAFSMSNDAQANQHTLGNFGFTVSRRASRTPRATSPNGSGYADHRRRRSGTPCGVLGAELESIVQQYQNRSISKLQACSQLVRRLESSVDVEEEAREQALGIYIAELDSIESVHRQVAEHAANAPRDENRPGDGANTFGTNERYTFLQLETATRTTNVLAALERATCKSIRSCGATLRSPSISVLRGVTSKLLCTLSFQTVVGGKLSIKSRTQQFQRSA